MSILGSLQLPGFFTSASSAIGPAVTGDSFVSKLYESKTMLLNEEKLMSRSSCVRNIAFLFFILFFASGARTQAQTSVFTYQGRFVDSTMPQPTNGNYEMQFSLFDTEQVGTGNQMDATKSFPIVAVTGGIFTVNLDFNPFWFTTAKCFIEIGIRPSFTFGPFTVLGPRQQVTSAPLASRSLSAAKADTASADFLEGMPASSFVLGTDARLLDNRNPSPSSSNYLQNQTANAQSASLKPVRQ